jgi:hypothetical protein
MEFEWERCECPWLGESDAYTDMTYLHTVYDTYLIESHIIDILFPSVLFYQSCNDTQRVATQLEKLSLAVCFSDYDAIINNLMSGIIFYETYEILTRLVEESCITLCGKMFYDILKVCIDQRSVSGVRTFMELGRADLGSCDIPSYMLDTMRGGLLKEEMCTTLIEFNFSFLHIRYTPREHDTGRMLHKLAEFGAIVPPSINNSPLRLEGISMLNILRRIGPCTPAQRAVAVGSLPIPTLIKTHFLHLK